MNILLNAMKEEKNHICTENGAKAYASTMNGLQDLFALGGSYRTRSDEDCILLFKKALEEDETYALKCLFYLRDCREGQGERRFFRVVIHWLACEHPEMVRRNLEYISKFGRWDDLYALVDTPLEKEMFKLMYHQLALDVSCNTPSLLAKWLKSENSSSRETRRLGEKTRKAFGMTPRQYRKTLSILRERIKVLERLMSQGRFDEIEFDKISSRAGFLYRNAFARRDLLKERYEKFAKDKSTKVNAGTLYPAEIVNRARYVRGGIEDTERLMINKYWDNLNDYFKDAVFNGVAVVDTSGSMIGCNLEVSPIDVAVSLGMYCGEKCNKNSPWAGHYITFSKNARLVPIEGIDFVDKVKRISNENLCENTNIRSVFDLLLKLAIENHLKQEDMMENIVIISDMEFDNCASFYDCDDWWRVDQGEGYESEMEAIAKIWKQNGYEMPRLIFWDVDARQNNISMRDNGRVTFVSGYSPVLFESILTGKTGIDLVLNKLNSSRYSPIY